MKIKSLQLNVIVLASFALMLITVSCSQQSATVEAAVDTPVAPTPEQMASRGEYLVGIMGCHDCHSPKVFGPQGPQLDPERLLSGHPADLAIGKVDPSVFSEWVLFNHHNTAAAGPWGVSYSANLTSDETGIGNWTLDQFKKALKEGKYKGLDGGRMLLPPMPWPNFANIADEDVAAIFAYLKSTKPISNAVPAPLPPAGS